MKHTEENLVKQKALDKKQGVEKGTKSGRSAQTKKLEALQTQRLIKMTPRPMLQKGRNESTSQAMRRIM